MTAYKLIGKLLGFKGFRCVGLAFRRGWRLEVLVKPFKNGCRCPYCGRRGKIVRQRAGRLTRPKCRLNLAMIANQAVQDRFLRMLGRLRAA